MTVFMFSSRIETKCNNVREMIFFYFWIFYLVPGLFSYRINDENLQKWITPDEWYRMTGEYYHRDEKDFEYKLADIQVPKRNSLLDAVNLTLPLFGYTVLLEFRASPKILDPSFVLLIRNENSTRLMTEGIPGKFPCLYRSQDKEIRAAVDLCGGVDGVVSKNNEYFLIKPLPTRFWKSPYNVIPHLIIKKKLQNLQLFDVQQSNYANGIKYSSRIKRSLPSSLEVRIETAVFVDHDLFRHMTSNFPINTERQLLRFVLAMVNAVQLLYHDSTLGYKVSFVLKRLEILHTEPAGLQRPHDIDRYLSSFCTWQQQENPPDDKNPLHWDHALMLTGLDLYVIGKTGKISNQVVGLAPVAGMCLPSSSCTVNEGRHFESVYVVAHEIGHNLGMRHDGPSADNNCDPGSHIMSPTLGSGKTTWSSCSKQYLQMFLQSPQAQCLFDSSGAQLDHSDGGALPGERFDADLQCMLKYGKGSGHAPSQTLEDVCRDLHCTRERYTWTSHPALEGTNCGHNKWCRRGRCVSKGMVDFVDRKTDGGWSDWGPYAECASGCLHGNHHLQQGSTGITIAYRRCNNPRPENGGRPCFGSDKRYQTCEAIQCGNIPPTTITEFAEQICRRAKEVDKDLTGTGFQRHSGDAEEACTVWCDQSNGGAKSRGWIFPDGTTCHTKRHNSQPMFCVSGRCEEFHCRPNNGTIFIASSTNCGTKFQRIQLKSAEPVWTPMGPCHYNCITPGRGLRVLKKGSEHNIQLCDPEKGCGRKKTIFEYASKVCGKYRERVRKLSGLGIQLSPSLEDPDRPCHVACQDENVFHRFYLVTGEDGWFPFGTDCARGTIGRKAHCVSGKCLEFGSDDTPLLESKFIFPNIRRKRSLELENSTIIATIDSSAIHRVIETLYQGTSSGTQTSQFSIDFSNPIHVKPEWEHENSTIPNVSRLK